MLQYIFIFIFLIFLLTDNKYLIKLRQYNSETEILLYNFIVDFIMLIPRLFVTLLQIIIIIYLMLLFII